MELTYQYSAVAWTASAKRDIWQSTAAPMAGGERLAGKDPRKHAYNTLTGVWESRAKEAAVPSSADHLQRVARNSGL